MFLGPALSLACTADSIKKGDSVDMCRIGRYEGRKERLRGDGVRIDGNYRAALSPKN